MWNWGFPAFDRLVNIGGKAGLCGLVFFHNQIFTQWNAKANAKKMTNVPEK